MHYDPVMLQIVGAILVILVVALAMRILRQPHVIGYLLAGILLGPHGLAFLTEQETIARVGEFGVVLLLFFVGMETSPRKLMENWRVTFLGTGVQIVGSIFLIWLLGLYLDWSWGQIVLLGFVISISSTAVVLNYLRLTGQMNSKIGRDALGVLLAQDLALIPMLLVIGFLGGSSQPDRQIYLLQGAGVVLVGALLTWMLVSKRVRLPLSPRIRQDHEMQLFLAFGLCLGFALITGLLQLSTALGAFIAGMLIGEARETTWVHEQLEPFRVVFVAVFFVSIGLLVDVEFLVGNWALVAFLVIAVFVGNTAINAVTFRMLGDPWRYAIFAGAHLAQIGEFSFVLAAAGAEQGLISDYILRLTVATIALSLMFSPAWISFIQRGQRRVLERA